jgi:hypothetical protein
VRSFVVQTVSAKSLKAVLTDNVFPSAKLMTDELAGYKKIGKESASHEVMNHGQYEYVRGDITTNTVEGFLSLLKPGINGVYHHVSREHLKRYLAEFYDRYNNRKINDTARVLSAIAGFEGKRPTYRASLA